MVLFRVAIDEHRERRRVYADFGEEREAELTLTLLVDKLDDELFVLVDFLDRANVYILRKLGQAGHNIAVIGVHMLDLIAGLFKLKFVLKISNSLKFLFYEFQIYDRTISWSLLNKNAPSFLLKIQKMKANIFTLEFYFYLLTFDRRFLNKNKMNSLTSSICISNQWFCLRQFMSFV